MRIAVAFCLLVSVGLSPAMAAPGDGKYVGSSRTLGGSIPACKGGGDMKAVVENRTIRIISAARDGTTRPGIGVVGIRGYFKAVKKLNTGGVIAYAGYVKRGTITGKWRGPTCYGVFSLSR